MLRGCNMIDSQSQNFSCTGLVVTHVNAFNCYIFDYEDDCTEEDIINDDINGFDYSSSRTRHRRLFHVKNSADDTDWWYGKHNRRFGHKKSYHKYNYQRQVTGNRQVLPSIGGKTAHHAPLKRDLTLMTSNPIYTPYDDDKITAKPRVTNNQPDSRSSSRWDIVLKKRQATKARIRHQRCLVVTRHRMSSVTPTRSKVTIPSLKNFDDFRHQFFKDNYQRLSTCLDPMWDHRIAGFRLTPLPSKVTLNFMGSMTQLNQKAGVSFHGSHINVMQSICDHGLLVPGTGNVKIMNGASYGHGIYSSTTAGYALGYARGTSSMFVCAVLREEDDAVHNYGHVIVCSDASRIVPLFIMDFDTVNKNPIFRYFNYPSKFPIHLYAYLSKKRSLVRRHMQAHRAIQNES
jgi:hypothetical protein